VQGSTIASPDQVWGGDIANIRLRYERVYLAVLMDVYTRGIHGWHLSRHLGQSLILAALRRELAHHRPAIHCSDQGVQYAATATIHTLYAHSVQISMAAIGEATENGCAERLIHTIYELRDAVKRVRRRPRLITSFFRGAKL
jgi:putative transposase